MDNELKKIIIASTSMFSGIMLEIVTREHFGEVLAFTLNREFMSSSTFEGMPVIAFEDLEEHYDMGNVEILLTFGYSNLNGTRERMYFECKRRNYKICTFISQKASVFSDTIGEGTIVMPNTYIGPCNYIGKCNIIWNGVQISHHDRIGDFNNISAGTIIAGEVSIGNNCFIGIGCTIKNGITIASKNVLSAASYICKNTKFNMAYAGNPAKSIKGFTATEVINLVQ